MPITKTPTRPTTRARAFRPGRALAALAALAGPVVLALAAPTLGAAAPARASAPPDAGQVLRIVEVSLQGDAAAWTGTVSFGLLTSGPAEARVVRPVPVGIDLTRTQCDMAGCVTTSIVTASGMASPSMARVSRRLTSAALDPSAIAVTVRRTSGGAPVGEYLAVLPLSVKARKAGEPTRVTDLIQGPEGERFTVTERMPMRAWVTMAGETVEAVAVASRARTVVGDIG